MQNRLSKKRLLQDAFSGKKSLLTCNRVFSAFTLAEMMVVMLIMSIILAAMAPVMTTRNKLDQSSPWQWATNGSDAYFGLGSAQIAMIGQTEATVADQSARLILNNSNDKKSILFKNGNIVNGYLQLGSSNVVLGKLKDSTTLGSMAVYIGNNGQASGSSSTAVGASSEAIDGSTSYGANSYASDTSIAVGNMSTAMGDNSIAMGTQSTASGANSIALGKEATTGSDNSIVIGTLTTLGSDVSGAISLGNQNIVSGNAIAIGPAGIQAKANSIAMGRESNAEGERSVAIGPYSYSNTDSVAIGSFSPDDGGALGASSVSIGDASSAEGVSSVAIGTQAFAKEGYSIAIGYNTSAPKNSVSIGSFSDASGYYSIAIGTTYSDEFKAMTKGNSSIAIGRHATANGDNTVAIGSNACQFVTGSNKVCIGADSGPSSSSAWASDNSERIFIGSRSKFNNGPAVLEVHNTSDTVPYNTWRWKDSSVVVNGNLIVKGAIFTSLVSENDLRPTGVGPAAVLGANTGDKEVKRVNRDAANLRNFYTKDGAEFRFPDGGSASGDDNWHLPSDRRLKYVGKESTAGLDKIRQLKVFNYTFKKDKTKTPHVGVIAQDLQKIFPDAVKKGADGFLTIRMEDMFYAVINAIKELDRKYAAQEKRINELEARIQKLEAKVK